MKQTTDNKISQAAGVVDDAIQSGKQKLTSALEAGSESLKAGGESVAAHLADGAQYLKNARPAHVYSDLRRMVWRYPVQSIVVALVAGLMIGRAMYSDPNSSDKYTY